MHCVSCQAVSPPCPPPTLLTTQAEFYIVGASRHSSTVSTDQIHADIAERDALSIPTPVPEESTGNKSAAADAKPAPVAEDEEEDCLCLGTMEEQRARKAAKEAERQRRKEEKAKRAEEKKKNGEECVIM